MKKMERNQRKFNQKSGPSPRFSQGNVLTLEQRILVEKQQEMLRNMSLNQGVSPFSSHIQSLTSPFNPVQPLLPALGNVLPAATLLPNLLSANNILPTPTPLLSSPAVLPYSGLANISARGQSSLLGPGPPRNSLYDGVESSIPRKNQGYQQNFSSEQSRNRSEEYTYNRSNVRERRSLSPESWENRMDHSGRSKDYESNMREFNERKMPSKAWGDKSSVRSFEQTSEASGGYRERRENNQVYRDARWENESDRNSDARSKGQTDFLRHEMQVPNKRGNWEKEQRDSPNLRRNQQDNARSDIYEENYSKKQKISEDGWVPPHNDREALWSGSARQSEENYESSRYSNPDKWSSPSRDVETLWSNKTSSNSVGVKRNESKPPEERWTGKRFPNDEARSSASNKPFYSDAPKSFSDRMTIDDNSQTRKQNYFKRDSNQALPLMPNEEKQSLVYNERGFRSGNRNSEFSRGVKESERRLNDNTEHQKQTGEDCWESRQQQVQNIKPLFPPSNFLYPDAGKKSSSDVWSRLDEGERPDNSPRLRNNERVAVEDILLTPENVFGWEGLKSLPVAAGLEQPNLKLHMGYLESQLSQLDDRILHIDNFTGLNNNAIIPTPGGIWDNQNAWVAPVENLSQPPTSEGDLRVLLKNKAKVVQQQESKESSLDSWSENMVVVSPFLKSNKLSRFEIMELRRLLSDRVHSLLDQNPDDVQPRILGTGKVCNKWFMVHCADKQSADWLLTWKPKLKSKPALNLCVRRGADTSRVTHISIFLKGVQETVRDVEIKLFRQNQHLEPTMWRRAPHSSSLNGLSISYFVDAACVRLLEANSWKVYYELAKFKVTVLEHKPTIPLVYDKL